MPATNTIRNGWANTLRGTPFSVTPFVSLHTADPSTTGASEIAGGSYARQAAGFGPASGGQVVNGGDIVFAGMPTTTVVYFGFWDSATGGNFLGGAHVTSAGGDSVAAGQNYRFVAGTLIWAVPG